MDAVSADSITLGYGAEAVLCDVSFTIPSGTLVALIGPNGSGKSTLLRAIAGLLRPIAGRLDVPATEDSGGVAFVLQSTTVESTLPLTVRETVGIARYAHAGLLRRRTTADRAAIRDAIERMDLTSLAREQLSELSGGQRQRALVAQGLAQEAPLLLLDEPFTGLDVVTRELITAAMRAECRAGRTVLVSTHELSDARQADIVLLLAGRLVAAGPPEQVLTPEILADAYGSRVVHLPGGGVLVDDPHHHHGHDDRAHTDHLGHTSPHPPTRP